MKESTTVIGCDVHKEKITAAVLPPAAVRPTEILTIENHPKAITRFVKRLTYRICSSWTNWVECNTWAS